MATVTFIRYEKQSAGALHGVAQYVSQREKTVENSRWLVDGQNCAPQLAAQEFAATRQMHRKDSPVWFYHYVQSFHPAEPVTGALAHKIAREFAERAWPDSEVLIATHIDAAHIHTHFLVNAVCYETGKMLRQGPSTLRTLRPLSDKLCMKYGLSVLPKEQRKESSMGMSAREYRSAAKGESWKFQLMNTVDLCMRSAKTRTEFINEMERRGYQVRWEENRKAITYTTPKGKKCRDDRLHEDKYRKEVMEHEFRIREEMLRRRIEGEEPAAGGTSLDGGVGQLAGDSQRSVPPDSGTGRWNGEAQLSRPGGTANADRGAGAGNGGNPSVAGAERTGWEEERGQAFAPAPSNLAPAQSGMALGHPDLAGAVGTLVQCGRRMEQSAKAVPPTDPVTAHSDRKALAKEREKKIALGHKQDDHEEQNITLSM